RLPAPQRLGQAELEALLPSRGDRLAEIPGRDDDVDLDSIEIVECSPGLLGRCPGEQFITDDRAVTLPGTDLRNNALPGTASRLGQSFQSFVAAHHHRRVDQVDPRADHQDTGVSEGLLV